MLDGLNQNYLGRSIPNLSKPYDAAKSQGNALEKCYLTWLNQHLEDADTDSPFLIRLKRHASDELGILPFVELINMCNNTVSFIKRTSSVELFEVTLKQECEICWNSVFMCLIIHSQLSWYVHFCSQKSAMYGIKKVLTILLKWGS